MAHLEALVRELLSVEENECDRDKLCLYDKTLKYVGYVKDGNLYDAQGNLVRSNVPENVVEDPADLIRVLITREEGFVI